MKASVSFLVSSVLVVGSSIECDSTPACTGAACVDASNVPGVSGGGCDSSKPASQGGCAVDDSDGFFVSPAGSDTASGAKTAPFQTLAKGITAASAAALKPNVYVCAGTFAENLVIQNAPAGVALHGGFECAGWTQVNANTIVAPVWIANAKTPQYVFHVLGAAALVEGMTLTAPDATDPGASSVAALIDGSPGMTFRRAIVTAGKGMDGVSATALAALAANSDGNSNTSNGLQGAAAKTCACSGDSTIGGQGGTYVDGGAPSDGLPSINGMDAGHAGTSGNCTGGSGADGTTSTTNGANATTLGVLSVAGWAPADGVAGATGGTAQGGGGGDWNIGNLLGGGGGACGGCGGKGGDAGKGGGGSIAVSAISSTLRFQNTIVRAGAGGKGGNGAAGEPGQPGGAGGFGAGNACFGGSGGTGGNGSAGGGGAGGVSIAIATASTTPDIDAQSTVLAGSAGQGGHDGTAAAVKAIDGIADPVHAF